MNILFHSVWCASKLESTTGADFDCIIFFKKKEIGNLARSNSYTVCCHKVVFSIANVWSWDGRKGSFISAGKDNKQTNQKQNLASDTSCCLLSAD